MADNTIQRVASIEDSGKPRPKAKTPTRTVTPPTVDKSTGANPTPSRSVPNPPSKPPRTKGQSTSVYFNNGAHLDYIEELIRRRPHTSMSSVMSQLLAAFCQAAMTTEGNVVKLDGKTIQI